MSPMTDISRRSFLLDSAAAAGGLALGFYLPWDPGTGRAVAAQSAEVNAWIVIQPDDTVIIRVARSEMGQGSFTALPMLVAEELECDWNKVKAEYASVAEHLRRNRVYVTFSTGGSRSIRGSHDFLRQAGATAREMLIAAAAQQWGVPASECRAASSLITHQPTGRSVTFGAVAEAASKLAPPKTVALKPPEQWKLIGKPVKRFDTADKVLGRPVFGVDVRLPDMLHAAIRQCPVFGGALKSYDESAAKSRKGVRQVVPLKDAVAVVAESWWQAKQALEAMPVTWDEGPNAKVSSADILAFLRGGLTAADAAVARKDGDVAVALARASKVVEAEYFAPFLAHATMEPMNCTAHVTADRVEVWVPTQNAEAALAAAADAAGMPPSKVEVHVTFLGGGFGRRGAVQDYTRQAVTIAKAVGKPVNLLWSREEDIQHDFYRPVSLAKFRAAVDASGMPIALHSRISGHSILASLFPTRVAKGADLNFLEGLHDMPYAIPNLLVDYAMRNTHVPVGFWRSVNHTQNAFFKECFLDELAHAAGQDPYQYRRRLLTGKSKELNVLDTAAQKAGWGQPLPAGVFRGIALNESYGSHCAEVAEVSVSEKGEVRVHRMVCAIDPGYIVNPDTVQAQAEGSIVYALTAALYGEISIKDGRVEQSNFGDYEMLLIHQMPKVEVYPVPTGGFWGGIGEPFTPPVFPAVCNAIFAATGKRIRSLPLKNHDLKKA
ncbi:MAG TPA: xanthine dehydrogenase family protein molybdopterin-binding subunit [Candidatus Methylomirabilis sp.]|nr:xanthine dehydrogenase family protein molybdopterin-binding subunit [Candidatus Methylomirabilis sp.]